VVIKSKIFLRSKSNFESAQSNKVPHRTYVSCVLILEDLARPFI